MPEIPKSFTWSPDLIISMRANMESAYIRENFDIVNKYASSFNVACFQLY